MFQLSYNIRFTSDNDSYKLPPASQTWSGKTQCRGIALDYHKYKYVSIHPFPILFSEKGSKSDSKSSSSSSKIGRYTHSLFDTLLNLLKSDSNIEAETQNTLPS